MWAFGHMGFGARIARPFSRGLPIGWLLLGTILPDLVDKPLYYVASWVTGARGFDIGMISCTRTVAHTALFALGVAAVAFFRKSKPLAAVSLGIATHLALDGFQDYWFHVVEGHAGESSATVAILFPFHLARFSEMPFASMHDHLLSIGRPFLIVSEAVGLLLLLGIWKVEGRRLRLSGRIGSFLKRPRADR